MKYLIFNIIFLLILASSCRNQNSGKETFSKLPQFQMQLLDSSTILSSNSFKTGKPSIFMLFSPDCPHCKKETQSMLQHVSDFKNVQVYFLASEPLPEIKEFVNKFHMDTVQNFTIGKDYHHSFAKIFKPKTIPYFVIYDGNHNLVKIYEESIDIDMLLKAVRA